MPTKNYYMTVGGTMRRRLLLLWTVWTLVVIVIPSSWCLAVDKSSQNCLMRPPNILCLSETVWRTAARNHQHTIRQLLLPGLTPPSHELNSGTHRQTSSSSSFYTDKSPSWTALDPKHPVYNFLIEYYGLKGAKGPRRLARWSPDPALLVSSSSSQRTHDNPSLYQGILLEGATEEDLGDLLHMRGAVVSSDTPGILYSPSLFFANYHHRNDHDHDHDHNNDSQSISNEHMAKQASSYLWYQQILQQTLSNEPILHCYGLHEWAMQYQPPNAPPPPSAKYQQHLPLRVSRQVINETVERKGVSCTHFDALRFFAPAALSWNKFGAPPTLTRTDQPRLEQPACVHATMDLLKMVLRLQPFCQAELVARVLAIALQARQLDVAASPYDATHYGVGVIPIETSQGRAEYKLRQRELLEDAAPVRAELLRAYDAFLQLAFSKETLEQARHSYLVGSTVSGNHAKQAQSSQSI